LLKNLWRRRLRTLLTLGGIAMAIGAFVALVGFSRSFEHEWMRMYESNGTASLSPWHLLEALGIAVLSGLAAGAVPAWHGAHLSPVEALHYE
jgi:ABC-type antimicrobial peptide transport system permease subunit